MSFRGRGGRGGRGGRFGRGGSSFNFQAKHAPHENFPEITLPEMRCAKATNEEKDLIKSTMKFDEFMRTSCYYLEPDAPKKKNDDKEIERYSDRKRKTRSKRESLKSYLILNRGNFPEELLGNIRRQPISKKLRWDKDSEEKAEELAKLEAKYKEGENKAEKDGEDKDDEDEEDEEEVEEEESSDDDYNQNIEFDDDEDDWNKEEEAQEDYYE